MRREPFGFDYFGRFGLLSFEEISFKVGKRTFFLLLGFYGLDILLEFYLFFFSSVLCLGVGYESGFLIRRGRREHLIR